MGVSITDAVAAGAGLAASAVIPGMLVKSPSTTTQKFLKIGAGVLVAIGTGIVVKKVAGATAGKMAIVGGLAGTAVQAFGALSPLKLPGVGALGGSAVIRQIADANVVSTGTTRDGETVGVLQP